MSLILAWPFIAFAQTGEGPLYFLEIETNNQYKVTAKLNGKDIGEAIPPQKRNFMMVINDQLKGSENRLSGEIEALSEDYEFGPEKPFIKIRKQKSPSSSKPMQTLAELVFPGPQTQLEKRFLIAQAGDTPPPAMTEATGDDEGVDDSIPPPPPVDQAADSDPSNPPPVENPQPAAEPIPTETTDMPTEPVDVETPELPAEPPSLEANLPLEDAAPRPAPEGQAQDEPALPLSLEDIEAKTVQAGPDNGVKISSRDKGLMFSHIRKLYHAYRTKNLEQVSTLLDRVYQVRGQMTGTPVEQVRKLESQALRGVMQSDQWKLAALNLGHLGPIKFEFTGKRVVVSSSAPMIYLQKPQQAAGESSAFEIRHFVFEKIEDQWTLVDL